MPGMPTFEVAGDPVRQVADRPPSGVRRPGVRDLPRRDAVDVTLKGREGRGAVVGEEVVLGGEGGEGIDGDAVVGAARVGDGGDALAGGPLDPRQRGDDRGAPGGCGRMGMREEDVRTVEIESRILG